MAEPTLAAPGVERTLAAGYDGEGDGEGDGAGDGEGDGAGDGEGEGTGEGDGEGEGAGTWNATRSEVQPALVSSAQREATASR